MVTRVVYTLLRHGVDTYDKVRALTDDDVVAMRNLGSVSLGIVQRMRLVGTLAGEPVEVPAPLGVRALVRLGHQHQGGQLWTLHVVGLEVEALPGHTLSVADLRQVKLGDRAEAYADNGHRCHVVACLCCGGPRDQGH